MNKTRVGNFSWLRSVIIAVQGMTEKLFIAGKGRIVMYGRAGQSNGSEEPNSYMQGRAEPGVVVKSETW